MPDKEKFLSDWWGLAKGIRTVGEKLAAGAEFDDPLEDGGVMTVRDMIAYLAGLSMGLAARVGVKYAWSSEQAIQSGVDKSLQ